MQSCLALLDNPPGQLLGPLGKHHPFSGKLLPGRFITFSGDSQKQNLQSCESMNLWLLQLSACIVSSQSNPKSQWITHAQIIVKSLLHCLAPTASLHRNSISSWCENKTPKLDVPCSMTRRIWSISSCSTFRVPRGLLTVFWRILLWHIGCLAKALLCSATAATGL